MIDPADTSDTCAPCYWCYADVGEPCRTRKAGRLVDGMHELRRALVVAVRSVAKAKEMVRT